MLPWVQLPVDLQNEFSGEGLRKEVYNKLMLPRAQLPVDLQKEFSDEGLGEDAHNKLICDHAGHGSETMNMPDAHPGCFNATNNHFHGGWVNPAGNSDNVLRLLHPGLGVVHEYEYNIPADHPAGTFWYHPHVHGSTALQVASGMAGALIVRGDRWPEPSRSGSGFRAGDIDLLLRKSDDTPIPDRTFLLQQIQYKCFDAKGDPKTDIWNCGKDDIGAIVNYNNLGGVDDNLRGNWDASGRFTTVNGYVADVLGIGSAADDKVVAGQPERWRFIHAGFNDTIKVQIFPAKRSESAKLSKSGGVASALRNTSAAEVDAAIKRLCEIDGPAIEMFEIAADGLTRVQALQTNSRILQPGYRSDVLVSFPQPEPDDDVQEYCVIDVEAPREQSAEGSLESKRLLFTVRVEKNKALEQVPDAKTAIRNTMVIAVAQAAVKRVREGKDISLIPAILIDLFDDLKLEHFSPHNTLIGKDVAEKWKSVDNVRLLRFNLIESEQRGAPGKRGHGIGHKRYSRADYESVAGDEAISGLVPKELLGKGKLDDFRFSERPDELIALQLGNTDEWRLRSQDIAHPFHIHVNPFQVVRVTRLDDQGRVVDLTEDETSQYFGMKGVFKDTIMVENGVEVVIRSHYERYVGRFVLHCHILPHEDRGMMRLVEIYEPSTPGGLQRIEEQQIELADQLDRGRKEDGKASAHSDH